MEVFFYTNEKLQFIYSVVKELMICFEFICSMLLEKGFNASVKGIDPGHFEQLADLGGNFLLLVYSLHVKVQPTV